MRRLKYIITLIAGVYLLQGCGAYSFSGINTTAATFQVNFFQNQATETVRLEEALLGTLAIINAQNSS